MSRNPSDLLSRYVDTTSPLIWPRTRNTNYKSVILPEQSTESVDKAKVFYQWTVEGPSSCYKKINQALLNDDYYTLREHVNYINQLRMAIKQSRSFESVKVYRGLKLQASDVHQLKTDMVFLWPTFSSTSRQRHVANCFGDYLFEIDASTNDGTYRADISSYSAYSESEILFYPYSGFRVKNVLKDARVIQLECVDTMKIESMCNSSSTTTQSSYTNYSSPTPVNNYYSSNNTVPIPAQNSYSYSTPRNSYSPSANIVTIPAHTIDSYSTPRNPYCSSSNIVTIPAHSYCSSSSPGGFYLSPNNAPTVMHTPAKNSIGNCTPYYNYPAGAQYHYNGRHYYN